MSQPIDVIGHIQTGQPDLETFLHDFQRIAKEYEWYFTRTGCIRASVDHCEMCPMMVMGWHLSGPKNRERPDTKNLGASCGGYGDRVAAAIVHISDNINSRYFQQSLRDRLITICKLNQRVLADEAI